MESRKSETVQVYFFVVKLAEDCDKRVGEMDNKRKVTPEKAVEIMRKSGSEITIEEAKIMLDFLYKFAKLTLETVLKR